MTREFDLAIVGGGLVGASLAFGLRHLGTRLALLDEGDVAYRAARGNFGLIWVQGKGLGLAPYASWTQASARAWPRFAVDLLQDTGIDVALAQPGGIHVCLSQREFDARAALLDALLSQPAFERYPVELLDRAALQARLPDLGPDVTGGSFSALDGHCNPLRLLHALHAALDRAGCRYLPGHSVDTIDTRAGRFLLRTPRGAVRAERIVLAAGLGNAELAPQVGLSAPVRPNRGQIIVLERVAPFLRLPLETLRQTDEGTVLIGDAQQDCGFDESTANDVLATMAARATRVFPFLREVRVVRTWGALRVMTRDGFPIYGKSATHPGAFVATCHSGVTLAAAHALLLAPALADSELPPLVAPYSPDRFDVRQAA